MTCKHVWPRQANLVTSRTIGRTTIMQCNNCCAVKVFIEIFCEGESVYHESIVQHPNDKGYVKV